MPPRIPTSSAYWSLRAEQILDRVFNDDDNILKTVQVQVNPSKPSFIYIYGWFPEIKKDSFFLLSQPMNFHEKQVTGDLIFPDKNHELIAELPTDTNKDSVSEYLIVLASKNRMAFTQKEPIGVVLAISANKRASIETHRIH